MSRSRRSSLAEPLPDPVSPAESVGAERLEREMEFVAAALTPGHEPGDERALSPRMISAAELVRRVQPFLGWN